MSDKVKSILILAVIAMVVWLTGYISGRRHFRDEVKMLVQTDTLVVRDTIRITEPKVIREKITDTMYVSVRDTVRINDTTYVMLPKQTKVYAEDDYYAEVSGYDPSLDYLEVYPKTRYINTTQTTSRKSSKWSFNLYAGVDLGWMQSSQYVTPNVGANIGYKRWSFGLSAGIDVPMQRQTTLTPYAEVGVKYNIIMFPRRE